MSADGDRRAFPWDEILAFALGRLLWTPDMLWRATPREIAAAMGASLPSSDPMRGHDLAALMSAYPDASTRR
ncbi:phage tail assembly chaperone [Enterovirga rhinocerotis]|uniref:phage tail assembly chaperone n=1 Tax=Enterovirga rhinocerotis TaxID=1339210 RepID=UPI00105E2E87|nr:phage tail assembly chaperone [Enterovirga rhinocerotis]